MGDSVLHLALTGILYHDRKEIDISEERKRYESDKVLVEKIASYYRLGEILLSDDENEYKDNTWSMPRGMQITRILEIGRDEWKVVCIFTELKCILMDILKAKTGWNCVQETFNTVSAHNMCKNIRVQMRRA